MITILSINLVLFVHDKVDIMNIYRRIDVQYWTQKVVAKKKKKLAALAYLFHASVIASVAKEMNIAGSLTTKLKEMT